MGFGKIGRSGMLLALALGACNNEQGFYERQARLEVTPDVADAGDVALGEEGEAMLTLTAIDGDVKVIAVQVTDVDGESWFEFDGELPIIEQATTYGLAIPYRPEEEGWHQARVYILSETQTAEIEVLVRGHAVQPSGQIWPKVLDFGVVEPGEEESLDLTVYNDGTADFTITEATFEGSLFSSSALPLTVGAGDLGTVPVTFSPSDDEAASDTLTLATDAFLTFPSVTLRGNDCENGSPDAYDVDGDGFLSCAGDCDDDDGDVSPTGTETCDGADEDCDGVVDEDTSCYDDDGDGYSEDDGDCNDGDAEVGPGAEEDMANGIDDDCDGVVDWGTSDADADGYSTAGGDCDDDDRSVYPYATELADGIDNDCDGVVDEGTTNYDDDGDGYAEADGDCDDADTDTYPSATELADWVDNDCDGTVDEGTDNYDDDGDGFSELGGDCDDADADVNPGEPEVSGDGVDNDCDGTAE